jgi:metal-responsive CopG/Arc/MetJ family transcriptional regulator
MKESVKIAISLPGEEFQELEANRNKEGISRSKFILQALKFWRKEKEKEKLIRIYVEGYKNTPENLRELEAWEKSSLSVFAEGDW